MKINVCSIGEAMIEISNIKNSLYNQSFAGDTLNFCNYLDKKKLNAFFLSAIGKSEINQSLLDFVKSKNISTKYIKQINQFEIGLYLIKNKDNGEKQFFYWRDESAAKQYFNNIDFLNLYKELKNFDYIYFSGITLSIIHISKLNNFIKLLNLLKSKKIKIVFDFNIRPSRWNKKNLNIFLDTVLKFVDICFLSGEDMNYWKNKNNIKSYEQIVRKYKLKHSIFRKNAKFTYVFLNKTSYVFKNKLLKTVVDTSGAGDGFNAAYLSNFIVNNDPVLALKAGSSLGSKIVMKKGAIVDVK
ncbi:PfkB family carbohydrate kinase [Pelagibacteraceae bacterium]|nr:PfkB family carbohydrate kinase [Pelagibacteraceae bacterium]